MPKIIKTIPEICHKEILSLKNKNDPKTIKESTKLLEIG